VPRLAQDAPSSSRGGHPRRPTPLRRLARCRSLGDVRIYLYVYTHPMPPGELQSLPAHWFQILLALADRDLHGLAITKEVFDRTEGRMQLWPGMLYGALRENT